MATFNERLKRLREEKNMTLDELAKALKTTKSTLSRYENALREPKVDFLSEASTFFGVTTDYLLGKTDERFPEKLKMISIDDLDFPEEMMKEMTLFFMNGKIAEKDKEKVMRDIQELYWKAKDKYDKEQNKYK